MEVNSMKSHSIVRLIKSEDLNHHGTLFAGRMAEWFVESTFIAAAAYYGNPQNIVCVKVHGFKFTTPVNKGDIIEMESKVLAVGTTSIHTYAKVRNINGGKILLDGFTTFVCVDENGKKMPHHLSQPIVETEEEEKLVKRVQELIKL